MSIEKVLVPSYFKDFVCIGSKCEDTCCRNWNITVSKDNYKKFKKLRKTPYAQYINDNIEINTKPSANRSDSYSLIKLKEDGNCPFLDENMLCNIYLKYGESYMPYTCITYPRTINSVGDDIEISLLLSCPEAARKALISNEVMEFEHIYVDYKDYKIIDIVYLNEDAKKKEHKYFWNIRIASISILQNRNFDIGVRFVLLAMLYGRIQNLINDNNYTDIPHCIAEFMESIDSDIYKGTFSNIKKNFNVQMLMYNEMVSDNLLDKDVCGEDLYGYIQDAVDFFKQADEKKYININSGEFSALMEAGGKTVIEHFIVNEFFRNLLPFDKKSDNIYDSLIYLCGNYAIIKAIIIGQIYKNKSITKDEMIAVISKISKNLGHIGIYGKYMINFIKIYQLSSWGGLYTLICS